jgi:hypothetical protein
MVANNPYSAIAARLLARDPPPPLSPRGVYDAALTARIDELEIPALGKATLHLLNDDLERSHELAQSSEGNRTADYLHSIVHRREGDFANSQYWLRRVEGHPLLAVIYGKDESAPFDFVDRCRSATSTPPRELVETQKRELGALLEEALRAP